MTTFGGEPHGYPPEDIDVPAPDGRLHAVLVKRGDVAQNANVFSLLVFRTDRLFTAAKPDTLLTMISESNRPAISHLKWLSDNHTVVFLGERPGGLSQVYSVDIRSRQLSQRTHAATGITNYDIAPSGGVLVYAVKQRADTSDYALMRQRGFALRPGQFLGDVLSGAWAESGSEWFSPVPEQLFISRAGAAAPLAATLPGPSYRSCDLRSVSIAPTGRKALILCTRQRVPASWGGYSEPLIAKLLTGGAARPEFALIDLARGTVEPLVDAPVLDATSQWAPTGESIVLANAFLPLDHVDSTERQLRAARPALAEIDVRTHQLTVIAHRDSMHVVAWDSATNIVECVPGRYGEGRLDGLRVRYQRTARGWREVATRVANLPVLVVEQGLNLPPRLVAVDRASMRRAVIFDANPELHRVRLGREQTVHWTTKSGDVRYGGLYYPPDFTEGQRYPLVIQTHGFDSTAFAPDGSFPTANAAQPIAARGMLVLQVGTGDYASAVRDMVTPLEAPRAMEEIEGAIDHLDDLGLIDRSRVGLIGFSRTCFHVLYTLTHSRYPIAAAALADGVDFSYLQYMIFRNAQLSVDNSLDEYTGINGGPPFGKGLVPWRERAPGFNLDRVTTPLRLEAIGLVSVLTEWEPYAGLLLQGKPVELFVIPEGSHLLVKPWERLASSQGNADWFDFWLNRHEDSDPSKAEQYARWRELRKLQQQQMAGDTAASEQKSR